MCKAERWSLLKLWLGTYLYNCKPVFSMQTFVFDESARLANNFGQVKGMNIHVDIERRSEWLSEGALG